MTKTLLSTMGKHSQTAFTQSRLVVIFMLFIGMHVSSAQALLPFSIQNTSTYTDDELYVAIVGENFSGQHIWIDCKNGAQNLMLASYNTVQGPIYNGNGGPGLNGKYANCFTKLSQIPNKTIMLPPIQGCRMFISTKQQLYFYFFGASGAQRGYTSPSHTDPTDPNKGIKYEIIELTYNQYGFWGNTTRVDSYQYPMGLELSGTGGYFKKTGELKSHAQIGADFKASVPAEFQSCYDAASGSILFPTKTVAWADGTIGTMPHVGPYVNYMKPYIDAVWAKYKNEDLIFSAGDAGVWRGRVQADDQLILTCQSGGFAGRRGIVQRRPTTQEAFEGKGVLDRVIQDATTDLVVQAQLCAALTRHLINTTTPNVGQQTWSNATTYYQTSPCNHYAKFWHRKDISVDGLSYGFAYDDVFDQSATLHTPSPTKVLALFGGYANTTPPNVAPTITLTGPANNTSFTSPATINITANASDVDGTVSKVEFFQGSTKLGEDLTSPYSFSWTGVGVGTYNITAKATDNKGSVTTSSAISINVTNPIVKTPYGGTRAAIPGTIEAERYDLGGQNIAFYDVTPANEGGAFRTDAVDIEATTGGGYNVGWIQSGEWLDYSVVVNTAGNYKIEARVAAIAAGKTFSLQMNGITLGNFSVPNTGGWQNWQIVTLNNIALTAGQKTLRVLATSNEFNVDKITFTNVVVTNPNQFPTVSLTAPANNTNYNAPASITISANASDADGSISKVEFYNGNTKIGEDLSAPYSMTWTNVGVGTYSISARAYDNMNTSTSSAAVSIKVNTVVVPDQCSGLPGYSENNGYNAGSKVKNAGRQYECKPWPYSGWCNGAAWAYAPGTGMYWTDAWVDKGTCAARTGSDESMAKTEEFSIFPNPALNELKITSEMDLTGSTIQIVDVMGRIVSAQTYQAAAMDVSSLDAGLYTIIISSENNGTIVKSFLKQ